MVKKTMKSELATNKMLLQSAFHTFDLESQAIQNLVSTLDQKMFLQVVEMITDCPGRILTTGCGGSGACAKKIAQGFNCVDRASYFLSPLDASHGDYGMIQPGDILIMLSKSGKSEELFPMIPVARKRGAKIIAVTENPNSVLAKDSDLCLILDAFPEACPYQCLSTSSAMTVLALFDAIDICCMLRNGIDLDYFRAVHPGGGVGAMLQEQAKTLE